MSIRDFSLNLQKVYDEMAQTFSAYQASTGLKCLTGCGRCCKNPEIEASVLEMIPFALKIYDEGKLDIWLDKLFESGQAHCLIFQANGEEGLGQCGSYQERPAVCRMFGVAGTFDKHHQVTLSICKYIKEAQPELALASEHTPLIPNWSSRLSSLDPALTQNKMPINQAIKAALEKIAFYAQYQVI
jgi:Fe-S-cluster containining protein